MTENRLIFRPEFKQWDTVYSKVADGLRGMVIGFYISPANALKYEVVWETDANTSHFFYAQELSATPFVLPKKKGKGEVNA